MGGRSEVNLDGPDRQHIGGMGGDDRDRCLPGGKGDPILAPRPRHKQQSYLIGKRWHDRGLRLACARSGPDFRAVGVGVNRGPVLSPSSRRRKGEEGVVPRCERMDRV